MDCQHLGEERGINGQSTKDPQGSETTLHDIIMVNICHYKFFHIHGELNKSEL